MGNKTYPNDPCPCGSGKKYKMCCGQPKGSSSTVSSTVAYHRYDMQQADFVEKNIDRDWLFLSNALQIVIGPAGYRFCKKNSEKLKGDHDETLKFLNQAIVADELGVYAQTEANPEDEHLSNTTAYGRMYMFETKNEDLGRAAEDFVSLVEKGMIYESQITLFHLYVLDNIRKRFQDYFYAPSDNWLEGQHYGISAHRGYDYLIGMSLYLELQLGTHLFDTGYAYSDLLKEVVIESRFDGIVDAETVTEKMGTFVDRYIETIESALADYDPGAELAFYRSINALDEKDYNSRLQLLETGDRLQKCSYREYLTYLVGAVCFNIPDLFTCARLAYPQCDFIKMLVGIESVHDLFEKAPVLSEEEKKLAKEWEYDPYQETVFLLLDEMYGASSGMMQVNRLKYKDPSELVFLEEEVETDEKGNVLVYNPAAKSTTVEKYQTRKLRMELYKLLSGRTLTLFLSPNPDKPSESKKVIVAGNYLLIPWLSSGEEKTVHSKPFDGNEHDLKDLYSEDIQVRKEYLNMEYRLTEIPVNCIEEYLNPSIYDNWRKMKEQNTKLEEINTRLSRLIQLNQELVRSLSHSSANYLNSDKLAKTGIELHKADDTNPTTERLHIEGLSLILQSEQEMFLSRQLNGLVWRCSADIDALTQLIRGGLSKEAGVSILSPIEFALKIVMARVLFREDDIRAEFIREKFHKTEHEITELQSSFMLDILAGEQEDGRVAEWWNENIGDLSISFSDVWKKLLILKDKSFYDLIAEIVTEQVLNALSHGDTDSPISIELGQAEEFKGRPRWTYIMCRNQNGRNYYGGRGVGISTLNETILMLNSNKRGIETSCEDSEFVNKVWMLASLVKAL